MKELKNQVPEINSLSDKKENGKERPWKEKKEQSINVSMVMDWGAVYELAMHESNMSFSEVCEWRDRYQELEGWLGRKSDKMNRCGEFLTFAVEPDGAKKLYQAWFCKDRLCPMCNWRRSLKLTAQMLKMLGVMQERKVTGRPIFLTLTMKNVKADDISGSFSKFADGFNRLMKYKAVDSWCLGAVRSSEVTYNADRDDYNTHIHCLLWMQSGYFNGKNYLSQEKWTGLWKRAAKLDYTPVVNVKAVKPKVTDKDPTGYIKAVLEVTKYAVKPTSVPYINGMVYGMTDDDKLNAGKVISALERGMFKKRLIGYFGIFKELHKELDLDDVEDGDLVGADEESEGTAVEKVTYAYDRSRHDYFKVTLEE